jgi:hypothetical protein
MYEFLNVDKEGSEKKTDKLDSPKNHGESGVDQ